MSIDNCQVCDKRLDTDFVEYQPDGSLYCGACEADLEEAKLQEPDWKALAGELAEALKGVQTGDCWCGAGIGDPRLVSHTHNCKQARTALAKYNEQEKGNAPNQRAERAND
jgi:hypothetical protein